MKKNLVGTRSLVVAAFLAAFVAVRPGPIRAHCDTFGGPVVKEGRAALEKGDITPVLKWVKNGQVAELKAAFDRTIAVRKQGPEARDLADRYFLETLVRLHRAGEGAPYTGLKDEPVDPVVAMADKSLESGSDRDMVKALSEHMAEAIGERFRKALAAQKTKGASVEAGREFVEAYVIYTHYLEALQAAIVGGAADHH